MLEHLVIRADASSAIGTGHVMRMIALAQAYQDRGGQVTMLCMTCPEAIAERVRSAGVNLEMIGNETPGSSRDIEHTVTRATALSAVWIVLDGYHFDVDFQKGVRNAGFCALAVDDYGHCAIWATDAVLNQNIHAPELSYRSESSNCRFLLGCRFVLLRREFRARAILVTENRSPKRGPIHRLLVTLGGADPANATGQIMQAINSILDMSLKIKVLLGGGNPHLETLRQIASTSHHSVEILCNVSDMPALYEWADGVISGGGSTCWEWLFYNLPAAIVCIAENQIPVVHSLSKLGLALDLGNHQSFNPKEKVSKLREWLQRSKNPSNASPRNVLVDGWGADRVAALLDGSELWLRPAVSSDCRTFFVWANDSVVRANSLNTDPIPWEDHESWFFRKLKSHDSRLWIALNLSDEPVGQVRLDKQESNVWEVDFSVDHRLRSQGFGSKIIKLALNSFRKESLSPVLARVRSNNYPSARIFTTLGFKRIEDGAQGLLQFMLRT